MASSTTQTATGTGVTVGTASTLILAANKKRKSANIVNASDEAIYLKLGAAAVSGEGIYLAASGGSYNIDLNNLYNGPIYGICASGGKVVTVNETP